MIYHKKRLAMLVAVISASLVFICIALDKYLLVTRPFIVPGELQSVCLTDPMLREPIEITDSKDLTEIAKWINLDAFTNVISYASIYDYPEASCNVTLILTNGNKISFSISGGVPSSWIYAESVQDEGEFLAGTTILSFCNRRFICKYRPKSLWPKENQIKFWPARDLK